MNTFDDRETLSVPTELDPEVLATARVEALRICGSGRTIALDAGAGEVVLGADPACALAIRDPCLSWHHCAFERRDGGRVAVRDLDSKNGTYVNGNRVQVSELRAGTLIRAGATTLVALGAAGRDRRSTLEQLLGKDPAFLAAVDTAQRAGRGDCTVLILGETGTGKELFARLIHESSRRAREPFVAINCGAIPRDLIGSELFGHERGAFTGAVAEHDGVFVQAHGGTLLLDEIGELPPMQQPNLLRVLETRRVRRVGGRHERRVDVAVVAATHRAHDRLREDLFHRLAMVVIRLPPLRDRRDDIPLLVHAFLDDLAPVYGRHEVSRVTMGRLCDYPWYGNVRELRQSVQRAVALSRSREVAFEDFLPSASRYQRVEPAACEADASLSRWDSAQIDLIKDTLEREGSIRRAAKVLGVSRSTLCDRLHRYGIASPARRLRPVRRMR